MLCYIQVLDLKTLEWSKVDEVPQSPLSLQQKQYPYQFPPGHNLVCGLHGHLWSKPWKLWSYHLWLQTLPCYFGMPVHIVISSWLQVLQWAFEWDRMLNYAQVWWTTKLLAVAGHSKEPVDTVATPSGCTLVIFWTGLLYCVFLKKFDCLNACSK